MYREKGCISDKSSFNTAIINKVKHFADSDYDYFCLFDAKDFINKLASASAFSSFRIDSSYTDAVLSAHANLVAYSTAQKGAGNAYGLCMYWCNNSTYSDMWVLQQLKLILQRGEVFIILTEPTNKI